MEYRYLFKIEGFSSDVVHNISVSSTRKIKVGDIRPMIKIAVLSSGVSFHFEPSSLFDNLVEDIEITCEKVGNDENNELNCFYSRYGDSQSLHTVDQNNNPVSQQDELQIGTYYMILKSITRQQLYIFGLDEINLLVKLDGNRWTNESGTVIL